MTWTVHQWVWRLEAPLSIGMPPAGSLNRCRPYIPARAMHGAVTAELARLNGDEKDKFPDYGKFGKEVGENCHFTYLYPAEGHENSFWVWLPRYVMPKPEEQKGKNDEETGLRWYPVPQNDPNGLSDRDFRRRLLTSRPGTAITPETDSASDGTLRETECINPWWRDPGCQKEPKSVLLLGYIFLKNNGFRKQLDQIKTLFIGGDTRYGLGKMVRLGWQEVPAGGFVFGKFVHLDKKNPEIQSDVVLGHALENARPQMAMRGMKELLGGWDIDKPWKKKDQENEFPSWVPGSSLEHLSSWSIDSYGYWIHSALPNKPE
jgi:hypothetical protein